MEPLESSNQKRTSFISGISLIWFLLFVFSTTVYSQNSFEQKILKKIDSLKITEVQPSFQYELYPNNALQGIMVPSGWGSYGTWAFAAFGGAYPQVYSNKGDLGGTAGVSVGNAYKSVSFAASVNIRDISSFDNFSANLSLSRALSKGSSISIGTFGLFASEEKSDAPEATYYVAFSHAVQSMPSKTPYRSKLSYTIGIGNARFLFKDKA